MVLEASSDFVGAERGRFIHAVKSSKEGAVGNKRYFKTKAVIPFLARASATSQPSFPMESQRYPPPGATMTAAPLALPFSGKNGVKVAWEIFLAIGSPHWRNQVSGAGWSFTDPVPKGIALGSFGASNGYIFPS